MAKKKVRGLIKFQVPAQKATPAPPVGPAFGPYGISAPQFVQQFNEASKNIEAGLPVPVIVTVYQDKTFSFEMKNPPASVLIKKELDLKSGSAEPHKTKVGKITYEQLRSIAEKKMSDLNANTIEAAMKIIAGTARSMGIEYKE